jgi:glyoxylase-like metal-dependent hydrolase (beta-lactamase superfamily II)
VVTQPAVVIGRIELVPLVDAVGELGELAELFPDTDDWEPYRQLYPDQFAGSRWRLPCTSYLLRSAGRTILVDTAVGPAGLWGWEAEWEEGLLPGLAQAGYRPDDVDAVFLTHLHIDHVGWNSDREGGPVFPRARFLAHRDAIAFALELDRPHVERCIRPLDFDELSGETEIAGGATAFSLPGHYPGHMGVRIESDGERAILIADAAVHPMLLDRPEASYVSDHDAQGSVATRLALLPQLVDEDVLAVCGHYPANGIGRVRRREGRVVWEPA